ncbi:hypothetical protein A0H81_08857 [Grifola frondosa]|uniref:F-box domain-containing protein n=1 Tax=Grifola frondosa TaxID=5627 RepID=A0A1C7M4B8_GRIFR|nr:hypothetical protein A0H81_08857 [Grifola frondosa]
MVILDASLSAVQIVDVLLSKLQDERVDRALSRAGICPLAVYVDRFRPKGAIWNLFISDGHRFKELHLIGLDRIHYAVSDNTSPNFLSFHAPQLEYLRIVHKRGFSTGSPPSTFTLFQGAVSNLRTMVLEDVPWLPTNHFPILQRLCIFLTPAVPAQWTLSDLLELLTRCPNLQNHPSRSASIFRASRSSHHDYRSTASAEIHHRQIIRNVGTHSYSPLIQWLLSHIVPHDESLVRLHGLTDLDLFTLRGLHLGVLERSTRIRIDTYYNHSFTACGPTSGIEISCQTYPPSTEALASFFSVLRTANIEELWITPGGRV